MRSAVQSVAACVPTRRMGTMSFSSHGSHGLRGNPLRERSAFRDAEHRCPRSHAEHGNDDVLVAEQPSEAGSVERIRQKISAMKKERKQFDFSHYFITGNNLFIKCRIVYSDGRLYSMQPYSWRADIATVLRDLNSL